MLDVHWFVLDTFYMKTTQILLSLIIATSTINAQEALDAIDAVTGGVYEGSGAFARAGNVAVGSGGAIIQAGTTFFTPTGVIQQAGCSYLTAHGTTVRAGESFISNKSTVVYVDGVFAGTRPAVVAGCTTLKAK